VFTGIVQQQGRVTAVERLDADARLHLDPGAALPGRCEPGDSVAVNGACLTVTGKTEDGLAFDLSAETVAKTCLADLAPGDRVNLETALLAADPVGGHFVTGHVDGVGEVRGVTGDGRSHRVRVAAPESLARFIAEKGSISVDGVSLTVNTVNGNVFEFNAVPHTWSVTNMGRYEAGTRVHLEVDLIARYLARLLEERTAEPEEEGITPGLLSRQGFAAPMSDAEIEEDEDWRDDGAGDRG